MPLLNQVSKLGNTLLDPRKLGLPLTGDDDDGLGNKLNLPLGGSFNLNAAPPPPGPDMPTPTPGFLTLGMLLTPPKEVLFLSNTARGSLMSLGY